MIGSLVPMAVSSLPGGFGMPDGSLFLFEDYPELKEKYDAGGFNGMLLEANATAEDKAAWAGKWVKHSEGIGLYAPRLQGLFLRNGGTLGQYNKPGMPNVIGQAVPDSTSATVLNAVYGGALYVLSDGQTAPAKGNYGEAIYRGFGFNASLCNSEYGAQPSVIPASVDMGAGLYLGRTA